MIFEGCAMSTKDGFSHSNRELVSSILAGGIPLKKAMEHLYRTSRKSVVAYVLKNSGNENEAEEVLHEGIIRLVEGILAKKINHKTNLKKYLFRICTNYWIDQKKYGKKILTDDYSKLIAKFMSEDNPLVIFTRREHQQLIREMLGSLGENCRKLLVWSTGEGIPMKDVASRLGFKNAESAMTQKNKCKKKLISMIHKRPDYKRLVFEILDQMDQKTK